MCSINQTSSWYYSLQTTIQPSYQKPINFLSTNHRNSSKITIFAVHNSKEDSSLPKPSSSNVPEIPKSDRIKLAFERAQKYKKSLVVNDVNQIIESPIPETGAIVNLSGDGDVRKEETVEVVTAATEKDEIYAKNEGLTNSQTGIVESSEDEDDGKEEVPEAVRIAMEKAREYKKNKGNVNDEKSNKEKDQSRGNEGGGETEVPEAVRIAMGKASEYKKNKGVLSSSNGPEKQYMTGLKNGGASNSRDETIEKNTNKKDDLKVSSIDFVGLGFADKKSSRGLPAGLVPFADPFPDGDSQEVEIIVGDASRFGNATSSETEKNSEEESSELYKPKVSTWGVFPRPSNISETYGGGRTIRPGDTLETAEDRAAKEAQTRKLLAAYKRKIGLNMDPKLKADCQKALNDGDSLMDGGRLKEALPYYQKVMDTLPFQTELHGLAALQWSISQDSLGRTEEARTMYEKLQSHPTGQVNKKARQFMFSFQAMEMMKVTKSSVSPRNTGYGSYFEAFVEDKPSYTSGNTDMQEDGVSRALPYIIIFLASPILLVLFAAARKGM